MVRHFEATKQSASKVHGKGDVKEKSSGGGQPSALGSNPFTHGGYDDFVVFEEDGEDGGMSSR